jgi:Fe-S-cluster-containing dehydrogenase component
MVDRTSGPGAESGADKDVDGKKSSLTISRRGFVSVGALAGCAVLGKTANALASKEFDGWPKAYGVLTDFTSCVGCRSCERACNEANNMPSQYAPYDDAAVFEQVRRPTPKALTVVNRYANPDDPEQVIFRKIQCNHCLEPACATACPIHAYTKTPEGAVTYDENLCFGCRYCMIACPFMVPAYDYENPITPKIVKCIFCSDRIKEGRLPACAEACPGGALTFGRRKSLLKLARKRIIESPDRYVDHIYGEHEVGGTSWLYISGVPFEHLGFPINLPKKPIVEFTRGYLSSVSMIFTVWPAIFAAIYTAVRQRDKKDTDSGQMIEKEKDK